MSINVNKNSKALLDAYNDVLNEKTDTKWAIFGYEGKTNDLKVVETGEGDLEDMVEELSGSKVMYAFIQVTDPNTQLPKNVLVNWVGEGVQTTRKGTCARHIPDVARLLRGAHVTINARSEIDLDEDEVMKKVSTASGAKFSVHKEKARPMPAAGPVGSVYKKADPSINTRERDAFWSKAEQDEERRRADEKRTASEQRKKEEEERKEREKREGSQREKITQERARRIDEQKRQEAADFKKQRDEQEADLQARLKQRESEVETERQRAQRDRQQRPNITSNIKGKLSAFEEKAAEQARPPPARPPKKVIRPPPAAAHEPSPPQEPTPLPKQPPREPEPEPEPEQDDWETEEQPTYDDMEPPQETEQYGDYATEDQYTEVPAEPDQPLYDDVDPQEEQPQESYSYDEQEPQQELYDDLEGATEQEPDQPMYDDVQGLEQEPDQPMYDDVQAEQEPDQPLYDDIQNENAGGSGLRARTLYDYQAEDDGEISFDPDEIIIDIEQIDPGWWSGTRELDGSKGIFPANYVELI